MCTVNDYIITALSTLSYKSHTYLQTTQENPQLLNFNLIINIYSNRNYVCTYSHRTENISNIQHKLNTFIIIYDLRSTHWSLGDMDVILKMQFSISF